MNKQRRTVVVGGGAAGMAAAIAAAECGDSVTVLERNPKTLKKLGVTGNGRCNLLNAGTPRYWGDAAFAEAVLSHSGFGELSAFFETLGVPLRSEDEGRVYPSALQASVVADALRLRALQLAVQVKPLTHVRRLAYADGGWTAYALESAAPPSDTKKHPAAPIEAVERKYRADRVIMTVGGAAAPVHGTDGTGYFLLTALGHTCTPLAPALCALQTGKKPVSGLAGQRIRAGLALLSREGEILHQTQGEVLFAEDGISGIAAMQLARFVREGSSLRLDIRPALGMDTASEQASSEFLHRTWINRSSLPVAELFTGALTGPVARALLRTAGCDDFSREIGSLPTALFGRLSRLLTGWSFPVTGVRGFENAQVTAGGIRTSEFSTTTMESRLCPGLYAAGEVLDVDGDCGGYNLMFAFASGLLAGRS